MLQKKTKIIATISKHNCSVKFIKRLYNAGMNLVRLNTAHMNHDEALMIIKNTREVSEKIGILLDTKGPEIRTCVCEKPLRVKHGDYIKIKGDPYLKSKKDIVCVTYKNFVKDVPQGSSVLIDDGNIALAVMDKNDKYLNCHVENDGVIHAQKSVNIPSIHVKLPTLSKKDKNFIKFAADNDLDFIAHSFVRTKRDVITIQNILNKKNSSIKIIAKIENYDGVKNLNKILDSAYGVMIARGDLAVEIPAEQIPLIQKKIINSCVNRRRPVIVATQMLHSMVNSPRPTRAEVSDVANACLDHADALMLSGETANGKYPELAVRIMTKIAKEVEDKQSSYINVNYEVDNQITAYLAKAAVKASLRLNTKAIIADSVTGKAIRAIVAYRGDNLVYAQVYDKKLMRRLSLSFGVFADYIAPDPTKPNVFKRSICRLLEEKHFHSNDLIIVLAGSFKREQGPSYIEISTAKLLKEKNF